MKAIHQTLQGPYDPFSSNLNNSPLAAPDINNPLLSLDFFSHHPEWISEHLEESKKHFSLFSITEIKDPTAKKTYETLLNRYPHLFPCKLIQLETLPANQIKLTLENPKVYDFFNVELNVTDPELLSFMKSAEDTELERNTVKLLYAAVNSGNEALKQQCIEKIMTNLHSVSLDQLPTILQAAVRLDLKDMIWKCLIHGLYYHKMDKEWHYEHEKSCLKKLNHHLEKITDRRTKDFFLMIKEFRPYISSKKANSQIWFEDTTGEISIEKFEPEKVPFLQLLSYFFPLSLSVSSNFKYKQHGNLLKEIGNIKKFECFCFKPNSFQEIRDYLELLSPFAVIQQLDLSNIKELTNEDLIELEKLLPNLNYLVIKNNKNITTISYENLKNFDCSGSGIINISLPNAKCVTVIDCDLKNIEYDVPRTCKVINTEYWD